MDTPTNTPIKKIIVMITSIAVLLMLVYFFVFRNSEPPVAYDEFGNPVSTQVVGADLVGLLEQIDSVTLSDSLFKKRAFINLKDYSTTLPQFPKGRTNPFDDIGRSASSANSR